MFIDRSSQEPMQLDAGVTRSTLPEASEAPIWGPPIGEDPGWTPESPETPPWGPPPGNDPGWTPESPETPPWGPPPGNDPGWMPESPETPPWGPPPGNDPGWMPESPETPPWGPPPGNDPGWMPESPETPPWGPSPGGTVVPVPPVIIVPGQPAQPSRGYSNVRFLHAAAGQPPVNIRLGSRVVIRGMQFGNATPYYLDTASRSRDIIVTDARTGAILSRGSFAFFDGTAYTVAIVNQGNGISLSSLVDMPCNSRNTGCVRAVNLSPNSGPVDIFLSGVGRAFRRVNPFSATEYRSLLQGTYHALVSEALPCVNNNAITIAEGYVECNNTRIAIMDVSSVNVMNGVSYTLYIIGFAYSFPALQILPLESDLIF